MDDYKSNSHKSKELQTSSPPKKKVQKVISGSATTQEKSGIQKFADIFVAEDVGNVKSYVFREVLIPALKKTISDVVTNGLDMFLYGGSGGNRRSNNTASKVSYRGYYERENDRRERNYRSSRGFDYDEIVFETRGDAETVLDSMNEVIGRFQFVSVADLYDLADVSNDNFNANKYGWKDIQGCKAVRVRDGYILKLPKPMPLD